jgi:hypothetical protein
MFFFKKKETTTEEVRSIIREVGEDLKKYGAQRLRKKWNREDNKDAWLGFFVCLIPIISIILFLSVPVLAAAIITVMMIGFILAIILNT